MNTFSRLLTCALFGLICITYSCNKDDDGDPSGCNYLTETNDELQAVTDAATAYGNDPTNPAKCQAWVDAYQAYLNELENHIDCATIYGNQAELQSAINDAQAQLDNINC